LSHFANKKKEKEKPKPLHLLTIHTTHPYKEEQEELILVQREM
jgi:hypothetical protein